MAWKCNNEFSVDCLLIEETFLMEAITIQEANIYTRTKIIFSGLLNKKETSIVITIIICLVYILEVREPQVQQHE